ncbi:MAG: hypothetical protein WBF33_20475 [Candidatus Nitrosopolaris sp.]|jgi:hypothetical protein
MSDELQEKQWIVSKIDQVLQVQLMKLQSEKDAIAKYRELYLQYFRSAVNATIASAAFVATVLIATVAFKVVPQFLGLAIILLVIDVFVGLLAFAIFGNHLRVSSQGWLRVEDSYNTTISHLQDLRIFVTQKALKIESVNTKQLNILSRYSRIHLHKDRKEMKDALQYALNSVYSTSYTTDILRRQLNEVTTSLEDDDKINATYLCKFEGERDFLSELVFSGIRSDFSSREGGKRLTRIDEFFNSVAKKYLNSQRSGQEF